MPKRLDTLKILEMLPLIYEDLDIDTIERRFFAMTTEIFSFDRLALFFVKHKKSLLQGKLSHGFTPGAIEALNIPLSADFIFTSPLITGVPVWNQIIDNDPYVKNLKLTNFAVIPVINRKRVSCWEITACKEHSCPAYGNRWLRCWLISNNKCSSGQNLSLEQKRQKCEECPVYQEGNADCVEGILLVDNSLSGVEINDNTVVVLSLLGHTVGAAINNSKRFERTLKISIKDDLTGIHNRRYFNERLVDELERVSRYPKDPLSLIMIDIDFFKQVNDSHGHQFGDSVLIWFAAFLSTKLRKSDVVARYGGEEFALLLINTSQTQALEVAEDLRQQIALRSHPATGTNITASFGVATFGERATSVDSLIAKADKALYAAKAQGRNRVCLAG
ncbi:MAG: GGDEF domain-containing protein [Desulfobulbaceae bacterium]|nr:GGDEF domain-containing protein [Desulfobulbaceae bacterium]